MLLSTVPVYLKVHSPGRLFTLAISRRLFATADVRLSASFVGPVVSTPVDSLSRLRVLERSRRPKRDEFDITMAESGQNDKRDSVVRCGSLTHSPIRRLTD